MSVYCFHKYLGGKFQHCDTHLGNTLVYKTGSSKGAWMYKFAESHLKDINLIIPNCGYYTVCYDFGRAGPCDYKGRVYDYFRVISSHGGM
jgi:predicted unusual protein kinase regulating ubiquinone biosynthesis (AarF/ABC1/UbiB family)